MNLTVTNDGPNAVSVIVDHDAVNDFTLEPGVTHGYDTPPDGVIEFRELGGSQGDLSGMTETA